MKGDWQHRCFIQVLAMIGGPMSGGPTGGDLAAEPWEVLSAWDEAVNE